MYLILTWKERSLFLAFCYVDISRKVSCIKMMSTRKLRSINNMLFYILLYLSPQNYHVFYILCTLDSCCCNFNVKHNSLYINGHLILTDVSGRIIYVDIVVLLDNNGFPCRLITESNGAQTEAFSNLIFIQGERNVESLLMEMNH